jgi:hypothetical protein
MLWLKNSFTKIFTRAVGAEFHCGFSARLMTLVPKNFPTIFNPHNIDTTSHTERSIAPKNNRHSIPIAHHAKFNGRNFLFCCVWQQQILFLQMR